MANSTLASTMASTSTEDFDLAVLRQLIMKVERNTEHNSAQMERLRSRPNWDDIRDSIQKELEAKIEDVRSTHGNIIDSLAVKVCNDQPVHLLLSLLNCQSGCNKPLLRVRRQAVCFCAVSLVGSALPNER